MPQKLLQIYIISFVYYRRFYKLNTHFLYLFVLKILLFFMHKYYFHIIQYRIQVCVPHWFSARLLNNCLPLSTIEKWFLFDGQRPLANQVPERSRAAIVHTFRHSPSRRSLVERINHLYISRTLGRATISKEPNRDRNASRRLWRNTLYWKLRTSHIWRHHHQLFREWEPVIQIEFCWIWKFNTIIFWKFDFSYWFWRKIIACFWC